MNPRLSMATLLFSASLANVALAVDGVIEINQTRASQGGVTAGDTPGFPVTISQPGSYRLTGDLTVPDANTDGIAVTADDVSIDLNGFGILGPAKCSGLPATCTGIGSGTGVFTTSNRNLAVTNGTVSGMGSTGVLAFGPSPATITNVRAVGNGGNGISVATGTVSQNQGESNGAAGIAAGGESLITDNRVFSNGDRGISCGSRATIARNHVLFNDGFGIFTADGSKVIDNVSSNNTGFGFGATANTTGYASNVFDQNTGGDVCGPATPIGTNLCSGSTSCTGPSACP